MARKSRRWLLPALIAIWVFAPELRRLVDWQVGFSALPLINVVPLVVLAPFILQLLRRREQPLPLALLVALSAWTIGFAFAFAVGLLAGERLPAIYELGLFALPTLACFWIFARENASQTYSDLASALAGCGIVVAAYGVFQYVSPPPWDVLWVNNSGLSSIGSPVPFGLRIFSTLNSYSACGDYLALALLAQLPFLRGSSAKWRIPGAFLMVAALALTFDRSAWISLAIGVVVYTMLSPQRFAVAGGVVAVAVLSAGLFTAGPSLFGDNPAFDTLTTRVSTLSDISQDDSFQGRQYEANVALRQTIDEPIGQGLGTFGTATRLGKAQSTTTIDGGYLQRLVEMGVFGFVAYLVALAAAFAVAIGAWHAAQRARKPSDAAAAAACIAIQAALMALDISSDHHNSLAGLLFWISVGISARLIVVNHRALIGIPSFVSNPLTA